MSVDIIKQLEKAKRFVEKGRIDRGHRSLSTVLTAVPNHQESMQSIGESLHHAESARSRGPILRDALDRLSSPREEAKALALYTRF